MKRLNIYLLALSTIILSCKNGQQENSTKTNDKTTTSELTFLDANKDGVLNPYEVLDVLFQLQKENKKELTIKSFKTIVENSKNQKKEEFSVFFDEFDINKDGKIQFKEANDDMKEFIIAMDENKDEAVTLSEMMNFDFSAALLASEEDINGRIKETFEEYGSNTIELAKAKKEQLERFSDWDENRDGILTKKEAYNSMKANNTPAIFNVKGDVAYMTGVITSTLPVTVLQLLFEHPNVKIIEMITVPGSIDDIANLRASLYVNKFGLTTKLNSRSSVASGGTDFFLAGKQRIVEKGAKIGVHSWGGGNVAATDVPKDDEAHKKYIDFYKITGIPEAFYWYTLEAAPANSIHWMTEEEMSKYKIRTNQ